jgi:hypothetical protein
MFKMLITLFKDVKSTEGVRCKGGQVTKLKKLRFCLYSIARDHFYLVAKYQILTQTNSHFMTFEKKNHFKNINLFGSKGRQVQDFFNLTESY